jgi:hypothetical protein
MREEFIGRVIAEVIGRGICQDCGKEKDLVAGRVCAFCFSKAIATNLALQFSGVRLQPTSSFNPPA